MDLGLKVCVLEFRRIKMRLDDQKGEKSSEPQLTLRVLLPQYYLLTGRVPEKELVYNSLALWWY